MNTSYIHVNDLPRLERLDRSLCDLVYTSEKRQEVPPTPVCVCACRHKRFFGAVDYVPELNLDYSRPIALRVMNIEMKRYVYFNAFAYVSMACGLCPECLTLYWFEIEYYT